MIRRCRLEKYDDKRRRELLSPRNGFVRYVNGRIRPLFSRRVKDVRRTSVQLLVAAALLVLLAVLGTLQYRWLGEVSHAERDRLRNTLRTRAADFTRAFDREITRTYTAFRLDPESFHGSAAGALSDAYARAEAESAVGGIVQAVYLFDAGDARASRMMRLDPVARTLAPVDWPPEFEEWRQRADHEPPLVPGMPPLVLGDAVDANTPALIVSLPAVKRVVTGNRVAIVHDTDGVIWTVILRLDADKVRRQLVALLLARHFGRPDESEYFVSVRSRGDAQRVIYATDGGAEVTPGNADMTAGMFDLRLDELSRFEAVARPGAPGDDPDAENRLAITIVRRANGPAAVRGLMGNGDERGAWQVLVRSKGGSLESVVARSRNRNLTIGLGILGLLAASFVFVIASARREQRLARQQLEFVASVSHELRTPLAVIRSAGENLADGVVGDGDQVRKYGSLIRAEGRRLSDMVERVLEFAGISSGAPIRARADVDFGRVVEDAARSVEVDAVDRGVVLAVRAARDLPPVAGDEGALRSAVQNLIGNAVKYSPDGATVAVDVEAVGDELRLTVADRGLGIDAADLPHIFKPFYRGRRAVDAQIRGTGVGLSVVRHVVDAHLGNVRVESRVGEGTTVVVMLPARTRREGFVSDAPQARAAT